MAIRTSLPPSNRRLMHLVPPGTKKEASITATLYVYVLMAVMDALIYFKTLEAQHPIRQPQDGMDQTLEISFFSIL